MTAPSRRIRIVWNGSAGSKGGITTNQLDDTAVRAVMREHGLGDDLVASDSEEAARAATREAMAAGYDVVVAAGGDGTTGTVASELLGSDTALGILPLGSIMNVARSLDIPRDLQAAGAVIAAGHVRRVDVGEVEGEPFFEAGSVGMNAALFREANKLDDGDWSSVLRTIWVAIRYRPARMALELDDRTVRTRALMVSVANGPYTGMGMQVAPDAAMDDGQFDVRVFRGYSKWELLRHLAGIAFGRYRYAPHVSTYRSTTVRVTSVHPLPARADARDLGTTPVTFHVRPGALCAIVPAPPGGSGVAGESATS